ncbi:MAG: hypothetical protein ACKOCW_03320, partial [Planctomycetaceae bacterium]
ARLSYHSIQGTSNVGMADLASMSGDHRRWRGGGRHGRRVPFAPFQCKPVGERRSRTGFPDG